jgi:hypothetical protein
MEAVYQIYEDAGLEWSSKLAQFILKQSYDFNPALVLSLSLAQFE